MQALFHDQRFRPAAFTLVRTLAVTPVGLAGTDFPSTDPSTDHTRAGRGGNPGGAVHQGGKIPA